MSIKKFTRTYIDRTDVNEKIITILYLTKNYINLLNVILMHDM